MTDSKIESAKKLLASGVPRPAQGRGQEPQRAIPTLYRCTSFSARLAYFAIRFLRRPLLREASYADRLKIHNADYGLAHNLAGLRPLWLILVAGSSLACWVAYFRMDGRMDLCLYSTVILLVALPLAFNILPAYVRDKADHYTESLFGAMMELDAEERRKAQQS